MELSHVLKLIPRECLVRGLRDSEEDVLRRVTGDVVHAQLMYRLVCRHVARRGRFPAYEDLPERCRDPYSRFRLGMQKKFRWGEFDPRQLRKIISRTHALLVRAAELHIGLEWVPQESGESRADRVEQYRRQVDRIERRYRVTKEGTREAPKIRPVMCVELNATFESTRKAADFLTHQNRKLTRRSDIRNAIRHGHRCGLWTFPDGRVVPLTWMYVESPAACGVMAA